VVHAFNNGVRYALKRVLTGYTLEQ
jgi:hypothetical protein